MAKKKRLLEKRGFWEGRAPCWETKKCVGKKGGAPDCNAYRNQDFPCWQVAETLCKMTTGTRAKPCRICAVWVRYHK